MSKVVRAIVQSESKDNDNHMIKITAEGFFKELEVESVNGIYLRKDDVVFVYIDDTMTQPLVLGRATGQLELTNLVNVLNDIIDKQKEIIDTLQKHKQTFDSHTHSCTLTVAGSSETGGAVSGTATGTVETTNPGMADQPDKLDNIEEDDLLKEQ